MQSPWCRLLRDSRHSFGGRWLAGCVRQPASGSRGARVADGAVRGGEGGVCSGACGFSFPWTFSRRAIPFALFAAPTQCPALRVHRGRAGPGRMRRAPAAPRRTAPAPPRCRSGLSTPAPGLSADVRGHRPRRAALRQTADAHLVVQGYRQTAAADTVAYVDALVQLRCSTVATTGKEARSAAASRPAKGKVTGVRFVVVADRPARRSGPAEPCDGQRVPWSDRCAAERPRLSTGGDGLRGAPTLEP
jgi:hypothetical protein